MRHAAVLLASWFEPVLVPDLWCGPWRGLCCDLRHGAWRCMAWLAATWLLVWYGTLLMPWIATMYVAVWLAVCGPRPCVPQPYVPRLVLWIMIRWIGSQCGLCCGLCCGLWCAAQLAEWIMPQLGVWLPTRLAVWLPEWSVLQVCGLAWGVVCVTTCGVAEGKAR